MSEISKQRGWKRRLGALATVGAAVASVAVIGAVDASADAPLDVLALSCEGRDREVASVGCRWTVPVDAAGVRLVRVTLGSGEGRIVVHRTDDPSMNTFVDSPVRRGVRYLYAVRALDARGDVIAASRPVVAGVAPTDHGVEALRLNCNATAATAVRCHWTDPESPARVLTLWRSVDGAARERVASFENPFPTSYGDTVRPGTSRVAYAVIATDGAGEIVARSRAEGVRMPLTDVRNSDRRPVDTRPFDEVAPDVAFPVVVAPEPAETAPTTTPVDVDEAPVRTTPEPVVPERTADTAPDRVEPVRTTPPVERTPERPVDEARAGDDSSPASNEPSGRSDQPEGVRPTSEAEPAR